MRLTLSLLVCFTVYCSATEKVERDLPRSYDLYPSYGPNPYYLHSPAYPSPYNLYNPVDQRFFRPSTTTTTTTTSTSTITCTKSTATPCGRRKRGILEENDNDEHQFPIVPTAVEGVEPTSEPSRDTRDANSEMYFMNPAFAYQPQSAFFSGPYNYRPVAMPYYEPYPNPVVGNRLWFTALATWITRTFTSTSTVFSISTSTSTPACSAVGTLPQCP